MTTPLINKELLEKIKKFAEDNWDNDGEGGVSVTDGEFDVTNPWIDHSGRFSLSDEQAVKEWGLDLVMEFCQKALAKLEEKPKLCGFVFCHGEKDFSACEVDISEPDQDAIMKILEKYQDSGTSVTNVYDEQFCDIFREK